MGDTGVGIYENKRVTGRIGEGTGWGWDNGVWETSGIGRGKTERVTEKGCEGHGGKGPISSDTNVTNNQICNCNTIYKI